MYLLIEITLSITALATFLMLLKGSWLIIQDKEHQHQQAGGTIQHLPYGIKRDDRVSYNNHSKNKPPKK